MFDEEWDADDAEARMRMLAALNEEDEESTAAESKPATADPLAQAEGEAHEHLIAVAVDALRSHSPHGHSSVLHGAPSLQASDSHGDQIRRQLFEDDAAFHATAPLSVRVNWGDSIDCGQAYTLALNSAGASSARSIGRHGQPLCVSLDAPRGDDAVCASLTWPGGSRHLHIPRALPRGGMPLGDLISVGDGSLPSAAQLLEPACADLGDLPDRGWAIELEVITLAADPEAKGYFTKADEWAGLVAQLEAEAARAPGEAVMREHIIARLRRCAEFQVTRDAHIMPSPTTFGRRVVRAACAAGELPDDGASLDSATPEVATREVAPIDAAALDVAAGPPSECGVLASQAAEPPPQRESVAQRGLRMMLGLPGTLKTEFKSPPPPHELNFARGGGDDVCAFVRLVRASGAAATSLSAYGHSGSSIHIHVNVASQRAAGELLSPDGILHVFLKWVVYDQVTAHMARPWMWREPSMAPLYATGTEFVWAEHAWQQGAFVGSAPRPTYDVPTFVAAVRAVRASPGYAALPPAAQLERLFGATKHDYQSLGTPAAALGRYCSLNLNRITSYGTLEFRRQHATLDAHAVCRWAHFCVAFVEAFCTPSALLRTVLEAPLDVALSALREAQATATLAQLQTEMAGSVTLAGLAALVKEGSGCG